MKQMIFAILGVTMVIGVTALLSHAADPPKKKDEPKAVEESKSAVAKFMRGKLHNAQGVLEGLTTEDFEKIAGSAQRMIIMAKAAEWNAYGGEVYARDTATFVDSAQELIKHAKDKNLDGATLSYVQLTMNCMACHKHLKGIKVASFREELPASVVLLK